MARGVGAGSPRGDCPDQGEAARQTGATSGPGPDTTRLVSAYITWDRWCKAKRKRHFTGNEGRAESARLVSELVNTADQLGTTHSELRGRIVEGIRSGRSIPQAIHDATMRSGEP